MEKYQRLILFVLISVVIILGWIMQSFIKQYVTGFPMAMIGGLIISLILQRTKYYESVNIETFRRIQVFAFIAYGFKGTISYSVLRGGILTTLMLIFILTYGALSVGVSSIVFFIIVMILSKLTGISETPYKLTCRNP